MASLPETNSSPPKNRPLEKELPIGKPHAFCRGTKRRKYVRFREGLYSRSLSFLRRLWDQNLERNTLQLGFQQ